VEQYLVYGTYVASAVGAAAVYAALPGQGRSRRGLAVALGAAGLAGLMLVLRDVAGSAADSVAFYILAILAVGGAARVITHPRPVYAALYFILVVLSTAGLAVLAGAEFLAAALVIVYAGAILVTYVFVIMLAQQSSADDRSTAASVQYDANAREPGAAVLAGFVLVATLAGVIAGQDWPVRPSAELAVGNTAAVGNVLLNRFAISVELAGVLLMVAMIGAIAIARKQIPHADEGADLPPPGEIGRRVKPF